MQAVRALGLRRGYATMPDAAAVARAASTPRAVRLRRAKFNPLPVREGAENDADAAGLSPSERIQYERQRVLGKLVGPDGQAIRAREWAERQRARRTRIRGIKGHVENLKPVGQTVYLPNIIIRLVRNQTPPGEPYNPYEATFRVPLSVTKTDIRSYLHSIYGVETTYIRTDVYRSPVKRSMEDGSWTRTESHRTYKRAVVGLVEPFYYPQALEDMSETDRAARKKWLEDTFAIDAMKTLQKGEMLRMTRSGSRDWKWRHGVVAQRGQILKRIMDRRNKRDVGIDQAAEELRTARATGEEILRV
jgi:large subunit ribosomal protein L23